MDELFYIPGRIGEAPQGAEAFFIPDRVNYIEAGMRPPKNLKKEMYERALRFIPWEKIRDNYVIPSAKEIRDSANNYMYRATNPSEKQLNEALMDYFRKFEK